MAKATQIITIPPTPAGGIVGEPAGPISVQPNGALTAVASPAAGNVLSFTDTGLPSGTDFAYKLRIKDLGNGNKVYYPPPVFVRTTYTPQQAIAIFNSLKTTGSYRGIPAGVNGGQTLRGLHVKGLLQTLNNVSVGNNIGAGQSPTGWLTPFWDNLCSPGAANGAAIPEGAYPFGVPCTAAGAVRSKGLYVPETSAALIASVGPADTTDFSVGTPDWPNNLFVNRNCGMTYGAVGRMVAGVISLQHGDTGGADTNFIDGNIMTDVQAFNDPAAGHMPGGALLSTGSKPMLYQAWFVKTTLSAYVANGNFKRRLMGRSLMTTVRPPQAGANYLATNRKLWIGRDNGQTVLPDTPGMETDCIFYGDGRPNKAQVAFLNDWVESVSWKPAEYWIDPRKTIVWFDGNSLQQPLDSADPLGNGSHTKHIVEGNRGMQRVDGVVLVNTAESGRNIPIDQGPFIRLWEDVDDSDRDEMGMAEGEWVNNSTTAQNYALGNSWLTMFGAKARRLIYTCIFAEIGGKTGRMPAVLNDVLANAVQGGHFDYILDFLSQAGYKTWAFGDGTDIVVNPATGQRAHLWGGLHYTHLANSLQEAIFNIGLRMLKGEDVSGLGFQIDPAAEFYNLNASASENVTPVWTVRNYLQQVLPGRQLRFTSLSPEFATVNNITGRIDGIAAGDAVILAETVEDGALGVTVARVTGTLPPVIPSIDHDWDFSSAANLFQSTDTSVAVAANNDPVGRVNDLGTAGGTLYIGTQATAGRRPLWKSAIQNGHGGASLDGSDDFLAINIAATPVGAHTLFIVCSPTAAAAFRIVYGRDFNQGDFNLAINGAHHTAYALTTAAGGKSVAGSVVADGGPVVLEATYDLSNMRVRTNGANEIVLAQSGNITANAADGLAIGAGTLLPSGSFEFFAGTVFRVVQFNQALSLAQRDLFTTQLRTYWGF